MSEEHLITCPNCGSTLGITIEFAEDLEAEQFAHWQTNQALATAQQELSELHALNLYDLVGDADTLRSEMVSTIKERDELREQVNNLRVKRGVDIANVEWLKLELKDARELYQNAIELCREAEKYVNYYEPSFMEFAGIVRCWAAANRAILDRKEKQE